MNSKKELLKKSRLYIIIDKDVNSRMLKPSLLSKILHAGAQVIQLRDKHGDKQSLLKQAIKLRNLLSSTSSIFIVNDYLDVAKIANSDGIHLGQKDCSVPLARRILGKEKIIGLSCHSIEQALQAKNRDVDYISIGPFFPTTLKPQHHTVSPAVIRYISRNIRIPFFVIGGINAKNITEVLSWGAKAVAVCRTVCKAKDPKSATQRLSRLLNLR